jgi:hypothetical protein
MTITDGEKTMTLEQLANMICNSYTAEECEWECPAREYCSTKHNGMADWLREVVSK